MIPYKQDGVWQELLDAYNDRDEAIHNFHMQRRLTYAALATAIGITAVAIHAVSVARNVQPPEVEPEIQVVTVEVERSPIYYNVPLDRFQQDTVRLIAGRYRMDPRLPLAVMAKETGFRNVIGDDGDSTGWMQVQERWHRERMKKLGVSSLSDFYDNVLVACDFLAELMEDHSTANALAYYNSGDYALPNQYAEDVLDIMESLEVVQNG